MGYHQRIINKGTIGEFSKIREEFQELLDAVEQNSPILQLVEMSDLIGAIGAYAERWNVSLSDLIRMQQATERAFKDGSRKSS